MKRWFDVKLNLLIAICTILMIVFSQLGANAYNTVFGDAFAKGTKIGPVNVEGLSKEKAEEQLVNAITDWRASTNFKLSYNGKETDLGQTVFDFDITGSVAGAIDGIKNPINLTINEQVLNEQYKKISAQSLKINNNDINKKLLQTASKLSDEHVNINVAKYLTDDPANKHIVATATINNVANVNYMNEWIEKFNALEIKAKSNFSMLSIANSSNYSDDRIQALNIISSGLYQLVLNSNFEVQERQISERMQSKIPLGYEALVNPKNADFVFYNPNETNYVIYLETKGRSLQLKMVGQPFENTYKTVTKGKKNFEPKVILQFSAILQPRETRIEEAGKPGVKIKTYKQTFDKNYNLIKEEKVSEDFYGPIHRIEVKGIVGTDENSIQFYK